MASLVIFAGLPGTGKSTIARHLAPEVPAFWLRIDAIEQALRSARNATTDLGLEGYQVGAALAHANLTAGLTVIADSVNPIPLTRALWDRTAHTADANMCRIEVICSDPQKHRHRVENRHPDIAGLNLPNWDAVQSRHYHPWPEADLQLDTAHLTPTEAVETILHQLACLR
ncbi:MAG: AAA family ATPase [Thalassovita sp.]